MSLPVFCFCFLFFKDGMQMSETKRVLLAERGRGVLLTTECRCLIQTSVARGEERRGVVERCASLSVGIFLFVLF